MRYDDIMAATTPYFTYVIRGEGTRFYYNFVSTSADVQTYICILPEAKLGTLNTMDNFYLKTEPADDIFLEFTDLVIPIDIKYKNKVSHEDQQKLLDKVQEFRITYPELFI